MDDTALVAAGRGNFLASRVIHRAHNEAGWRLYAPTCALVEADRTHPGTAEHFASMPGVVLLELDTPAALAVAKQDTWSMAHVLHAAEPTPERPSGGVVATMERDRWKGAPVRLLDLNP
ncbi:hypothetical protein BKD26_16435 [Streptomyces sp. CB03238]|nr:hypothetical protein BKD26_16435 [Streptomyces sp. CB03238]